MAKNTKSPSNIDNMIFMNKPGVALAPKILEPKKSSILIFCRQFSNIEVKQNASKNLDNSTNMCDRHRFYSLLLLLFAYNIITLKHTCNIICTINWMLHDVTKLIKFKLIAWSCFIFLPIETCDIQVDHSMVRPSKKNVLVLR
jgi:hypothetical protein